MKTKSLKKIILGILALGLIGLTSCEKMEVVKVIGFIQGHVFNGNSNEVLDSVKVEYTVAGTKYETAAFASEGYLVPDLPSGTFSIWFSKTNYTTVVAEVTVPTTASVEKVRGGDHQEYIKTVDPNLYPLDAGVTGRVYIEKNGVEVPVEGAVVELDYNTDQQENDESFRFVPNIYQATTDADGYYTFTNVPATAVTLRVLDYSDGEDTYYDPGSGGMMFVLPHGEGRTLYLQSGQSFNQDNIYLNMVIDDFMLIGSNVYDELNVTTQSFDVTSDITLTFNKPVNETATVAMGTLTLNGQDYTSGNYNDVVSITATYSGNTITINPDEDLKANTNYQLTYNVYPANLGDATGAINITFKTADPATVPAQVTGFVLNMGGGWDADYNTTSVSFEFNTIEDATGYEIFARDDNNNTEYVLVGTVNQADDYVDPMQYITADLTDVPSFDYYFDDTYQTPFSHGTEVSFKVRAVNSAGKGEFSTVRTYGDEIAIDAGDIYLREDDGSTIDATDLNNTTASAIDVTIHVYASNDQYFDESSVPSITVIEDNGGATISVDATNVTFVDHTHLTFEVTIPAGENYYSGVLEIDGLTDSSGNEAVFTEDFQ